MKGKTFKKRFEDIIIEKLTKEDPNYLYNTDEIIILVSNSLDEVLSDFDEIEECKGKAKAKTFQYDPDINEHSSRFVDNGSASCVSPFVYHKKRLF